MRTRVEAGYWARFGRRIRRHHPARIRRTWAGSVRSRAFAGFRSVPGSGRRCSKKAPPKLPDGMPETHAASGADDAIEAPVTSRRSDRSAGHQESAYARIGSDMSPELEERGQNGASTASSTAVLLGAQRGLHLQARVSGLGRSVHSRPHRQAEAGSCVPVRRSVLQSSQRGAGGRRAVPGRVELARPSAQEPHDHRRAAREPRDSRRSRQLASAAVLHR